MRSDQNIWKFLVLTDIRRHESPAKINPRGDKALSVWSREEYVSRVHSSPIRPISVMSLVSIHISLDSRCWYGWLRKVLIVDPLLRFTFDPFWRRDYFSLSVHGRSWTLLIDWRSTVEAECNIKSMNLSSPFNDVGKRLGRTWSQTWGTASVPRSQRRIW